MESDNSKSASGVDPGSCQAFVSCAKATITDLVPRVLSASMSAPGTVKTKHDGSLVTSVDTLVESELVSALSAVFVGAPVLGEEGAIDRTVAVGVGQRSVYAEFMQAPLQVIIDPIDGTRNFVDRKPQYCIAAALTHRVSDGIWPVAGVIAVPSEGLLYWCDDQRVYVEELASGERRQLSAGSVKAAATTVSVSSRDRSWLAKQGLELTVPGTSSGSSVYDLLQTILGRQRASLVGSQRLWDLMAPLALAARLGLELRDLFSGEQVTTLSVSDLSSDVVARPWGLDRRMVLARAGEDVCQFVKASGE